MRYISSVHVKLSSRTRTLFSSLSLHLLPYLVYMSRTVAAGVAHLFRLVLTVAANNKIFCWLKHYRVLDNKCVCGEMKIAFEKTMLFRTVYLTWI